MMKYYSRWKITRKEKNEEYPDETHLSEILIIVTQVYFLKWGMGTVFCNQKWP